MRMMYISGLHIKTTLNLQRKEARKNSVRMSLPLPLTPSCTITDGDTNETSPSEDPNSRSQYPHYESDDTVILKTDSDSDTDYLDATESCKRKRNSKCET